LFPRSALQQRDPEFETEADGAAADFDLEPQREDGEELTRDDISELLLEEIREFHPDAPIFKRRDSFGLSAEGLVEEDQ
jgi:hypothetical protein